MGGSVMLGKTTGKAPSKTPRSHIIQRKSFYSTQQDVKEKFEKLEARLTTKILSPTWSEKKARGLTRFLPHSSSPPRRIKPRMLFSNLLLSPSPKKVAHLKSPSDFDSPCKGTRSNTVDIRSLRENETGKLHLKQATIKLFQSPVGNRVVSERSLLSPRVILSPVKVGNCTPKKSVSCNVNLPNSGVVMHQPRNFTSNNLTKLKSLPVRISRKTQICLSFANDSDLEEETGLGEKHAIPNEVAQTTPEVAQATTVEVQENQTNRNFIMSPRRSSRLLGNFSQKSQVQSTQTLLHSSSADKENTSNVPSVKDEICKNRSDSLFQGLATGMSTLSPSKRKISLGSSLSPLSKKRRSSVLLCENSTTSDDSQQYFDNEEVFIRSKRTTRSSKSRLSFSQSDSTTSTTDLSKVNSKATDNDSSVRNDSDLSVQSAPGFTTKSYLKASSSSSSQDSAVFMSLDKNLMNSNNVGSNLSEVSPLTFTSFNKSLKHKSSGLTSSEVSSSSSPVFDSIHNLPSVDASKSPSCQTDNVSTCQMSPSCQNDSVNTSLMSPSCQKDGVSVRLLSPSRQKDGVNPSRISPKGDGNKKYSPLTSAKSLVMLIESPLINKDNHRQRRCSTRNKSPAVSQKREQLSGETNSDNKRKDARRSLYRTKTNLNDLNS